MKSIIPRWPSVRWFDENGAGAVAEQHAGGAILKVNDGTHDVSADHKHFVVSARGDELGAGRQSVNEPGARARKIESPGFLGADLRLDKARR